MSFNCINPVKAVELSHTRKNIKVLAEELHVRPELIYRWRSKFAILEQASFPGNGKRKMIAEQSEGARSQKELDDYAHGAGQLKKGEGLVVTTDSKHPFPVVENVLNRIFNPATIGKAWVSDITYIKTAQGWLYLTVILDLGDRKVIGWSLSKSLKAIHTTIPESAQSSLYLFPQLQLFCLSLKATENVFGSVELI